jgi:predicted SAM-dependent methyltransferase
MPRAELLGALGAAYGDPGSVVETTVVDDGERLERFESGSLDFLIANHLLEHLEDPVGALTNWTRVLRPGGIIFITVPDARRTFDAARPRTTVEHVVRDHREGPGTSRAEHYREWAHIIECLPEERVAERMAEYARRNRREHFHVWELETFLDLLCRLDLPVRLEVAQAAADEFAVILRKDHGPSGQV